MTRTPIRRLLGALLAVLVASTMTVTPPALAQEDGPEERDPVEGIAGVPIGEVCAVQGTLVLLETVARSSLPPELLRSLVETLGIPFQGVCTLVPPRDRLTRCVGDKEVNDTSQGLVGAAPVGDVVQILEEVEGAAGVDGAVSQSLVDALACEQFRFGESDDDPDGEIFVPPARPTGMTGPPGSDEPLAPTGTSTSPSPSTAGVTTGPAPTSTTPSSTVADAADDGEIAAPPADTVASITDQIDLFAVLVCLALILGTAYSLLPEGWLAGVRRRRSAA